LINEYLSKGLNSNNYPIENINYKFQIENKIKRILDIKNNKIEDEINDIKEKFCFELYEKYLKNTNSDEIKFNEDLILLEVKSY
jgi:hypothetical protein